MRMSSLSTQHLIFRQVSTRPLRQCEPTRFETTPSRRMPSASAKTSGPLPAIASLNCRRDLGDGGTIRRSSALRSSSAARSRASVEAAAIGSIDIGAASLPEKRPLTSFIGLGESDVAGAMVNVSNERRSCELAIYASNSVLRRAPRRAGDRAPALHFQPSRNLRIWRCTQPDAYIAGVRAGTRCQLTCWRGHRPQDHHQPYLPCGTTVAGRGLVTHTRLNVPTRTPISRQFLIRLDAGRLGLRACGKARGRGQRDDNCRSSGENDLLHGWSPF